MTLRRTLAIAMAAVGTVAVGAALALVMLTSSLTAASVELAGALDRVRLLMSLETYALEHVRASGTDLQHAIETIDDLEERVGPGRVPELQRLRGTVRDLAAASTDTERDAALAVVSGQLRTMVDREDQDAVQAVEAATRWKQLADAIGVVAVIVLLSAVFGALLWVWRSALRPLVTVAHAIHRLAGGDAGVRVPENGPEEIEQIAAAFNHMAASLSRQREEQLAFIGGVAHDLRTPLNALQGSVAVLALAPPAQSAHVRGRVQRQVARLDRMIGDLLDGTRIEAGRFDLRLEHCDLREVVTRAVELRRESGAGRTFRVALPPQPVATSCDPLRLEQVLVNLLSNAEKYSPESADVEIRLVREGASAQLSVTDHGVGIRRADLDRIFEPFRRGRNVGGIGGAGLGLSVTRKLVEAHGGTITVQSEPGRGSVFMVSLPLSPAQAPPSSSGTHVPGAAVAAADRLS